MNGQRPPYGVRLAARLATGWRPAGRTIHVAAGSGAWELAMRWAHERYGARAFICFPVDCDPEDYDFRVVRDFYAVVFDTGALAFTAEQSLAKHLIWAGAVRVLVVRNVTSPVPRVIRYRPVRRAA